MNLAEEVLALHDGIREVFVLEERAGTHVVSEEAARSDISILSGHMMEGGRNTSLAPSIILGAATQFGGESEAFKLAGMLYDKEGVLFSYLNENRLLAVSASTESFYTVMQVVDDFLQRLKEQQALLKKDVSVRSAAVAEDIARFFLQGKLGASPFVFIDDVSYREANHRWEIRGSYRSSRWISSKRFQVEIDAEQGSVMRFSSASSVSKLFYAEIASLLAAGLLLAWLLYVNFPK